MSLTTLAKTKEKYEKAFGASERALEAYNKADADLNLSRADVEKQRMNSNIKRQQMDDSKNEYANQLQKTNELQVRGIVKLTHATIWMGDESRAPYPPPPLTAGGGCCSHAWSILHGFVRIGFCR